MQNSMDKLHKTHMKGVAFNHFLLQQRIILHPRHLIAWDVLAESYNKEEIKSCESILLINLF